MNKPRKKQYRTWLTYREKREAAELAFRYYTLRTKQHQSAANFFFHYLRHLELTQVVIPTEEEVRERKILRRYLIDASQKCEDADKEAKAIAAELRTFTAPNWMANLLYQWRNIMKL